MNRDGPTTHNPRPSKLMDSKYRYKYTEAIHEATVARSKIRTSSSRRFTVSSYTTRCTVFE